MLTEVEMAVLRLAIAGWARALGQSILDADETAIAALCEELLQDMITLARITHEETTQRATTPSVN